MSDGSSDTETPSEGGRSYSLAGVVTTVADHTTDIAGIAAIAYMATHGVSGYEPYAVVASVAVGKRWFQAKRA